MEMEQIWNTDREYYIKITQVEDKNKKKKKEILKDPQGHKRRKPYQT